VRLSASRCTAARRPSSAFAVLQALLLDGNDQPGEVVGGLCQPQRLAGVAHVEHRPAT
jgi:hypothetical protein